MDMIDSHYTKKELRRLKELRRKKNIETGYNNFVKTVENDTMQFIDIFKEIHINKQLKSLFEKDIEIHGMYTIMTKDIVILDIIDISNAKCEISTYGNGVLEKVLSENKKVDITEEFFDFSNYDNYYVKLGYDDKYETPIINLITVFKHLNNENEINFVDFKNSIFYCSLKKGNYKKRVMTS